MKTHNLIAVDRGVLQLVLNTLRRNAEERGFTVQGEIADELQKSARVIPQSPREWFETWANEYGLDLTPAKYAKHLLTYQDESTEDAWTTVNAYVSAHYGVSKNET